MALVSGGLRKSHLLVQTTSITPYGDIYQAILLRPAQLGLSGATDNFAHSSGV